MTIEDTEQAAIMYNLGKISRQNYLDIILEYTNQPESPLLVQAKARLRPQ